VPYARFCAKSADSTLFTLERPIEEALALSPPSAWRRQNRRRLKRGRASDQLLRYLGYVQEELAEPGQIVEGAIIALEDDQRIRRALAVVHGFAFYRYQLQTDQNAPRLN